MLETTGTVESSQHGVAAMLRTCRALHCTRDEDAAEKNDHRISSLILDASIGRGGENDRRVRF